MRRAAGESTIRALAAPPLRRLRLLLTCEHASCHVPAKYRALFDGAQRELKGHRGWDPGALTIAAALQRRFAAPLFATRVSRLLVEVNRSLHHAQLFSEFSRGLSDDDKQAILARYYHRHRDAVRRWIAEGIRQGDRVCHVGIHTFAPVLHGVERRCEIGLLYDPRRSLEWSFCTAWSAGLKGLDSGLRVRRNYPYRGVSDGLTTFLRTQFAASDYAGIELEVNQRLATAPRRSRQCATWIAQSLARTLDAFAP